MGNKDKEKDQRLLLLKAMEKELNYKRYVHTLGVAYTATSLAMRYGTDVAKAETAGILHDCAKCIGTGEMEELCREGGLSISALEKGNPSLLHSKAGSVLAGKKYGISDPEIVSAIAFHTTGRPGMTDLEKIIFISDYIEPGRVQAPGLPEIRRTVFTESLDKGLLMILSDTLSYLHTTEMPIDDMTQTTYDYYRANEGKTRI